jgi:hypothetical protein
MAMEVVNVTEQLYKGGTITVSSVPHARRHQAVSAPQGRTDIIRAGTTYSNLIYEGANGAGVGGYIDGSFTASMRDVDAGPPSSLDDAMAYPGTTQWDCAEGAYTVCTFDIDDNLPSQGAQRGTTFSNFDFDFVEAKTFGDNDGLGAFVYVPDRRYHANTTGGGATMHTSEIVLPASSAWTTGVGLPLTQPIPFNIRSIMCTGLPVQTKLTINVTFIIEVFPRRNDPGYGQLVYSASPSPSEDPVALHLYQAIADRMPVAVPSKDNRSGGFWGMLGTLASTVLAPELAPLVAATTIAAPAIIRAVSSKKRKTKRKKRAGSAAPSRASSRASSTASRASSLKKRVKLASAKMQR